ncbi:MAG: protein-L-isoaspartate(D-aspartate) O-methyltransferase, partial [Nitrospiraceae bacterium]|nr:protein-L-isoaspartate(D-aspartate) O-methyltransferase [Nitrospiraceae bacterium]
QTISQPYIVALMTAALELTGQEKVLEIGTGSGYQTAILAELTRKVYTIERITALSLAAQDRLRKLGYTNVKFFIGDGTVGLPDEAPFDRIIATGGFPRLPVTLLAQLADPGIIVAPVGGRTFQRLLQVRKRGDTFTKVDLGGCRFVPLTGKEGW